MIIVLRNGYGDTSSNHGKADCIKRRSISLKKGTIPIIFRTARSHCFCFFILHLVRQKFFEKQNYEFKSITLRLKLTLCPHTARAK